jgi:hypothetical protein
MASSALSSGFLSLTLTISASTRMLSPPFTFLYKNKYFSLQTLYRFFSNFHECATESTLPESERFFWEKKKSRT